MRRFSLVLVAVVAFTGVPAVAAAPGPEISEGRVSPARYVVTTGDGPEVVVRVRVKNTAGFQVRWWSEPPPAPDDDRQCDGIHVLGLPMELVSGTAEDGIWQAVPWTPRSLPPGWHSYTVGVVARGDDQWKKPVVSAPAGRLHVLRKTLISRFDAGPEPLRKGSKLKVSGFAKEIDNCESFGPWSPKSGDYRALTDQKVRLEFRGKGAKAFRYVAIARTDYEGRFSKKIAWSKAGTWRAVLVGNSTRAPSRSRSDYVGVRRSS